MSESIFAGLQKLTLLDFPERVACTLFTRGCNMRCPFCHNAALVVRANEQKMYTNEDIMSFLKKRVGILEGVVVTGGEPTLMRGLGDFLARAKELGYKTKLDTNGTNPITLKNLIDSKLVDYVAMDIKNCREKYGLTVGFGDNYDLSGIDESVNILMNGNVDFEFRTTVCKTFHTENDIEKIGKWLQGNEKFFLQQFKDSGDIIGGGIEPYSEVEMGRLLDIILQFVPNAQLRGI